MGRTWVGAIAMGARVVVWNQEFVGLWVGQEYYVGSTVNLLIVLMVIQLVLIRNDAFMIDLTLDLRRKVLIGALSAILSIAAAGILMAFFDLGILGLCLGYIAGRSILSLAYPWMVGRFLGVSLHFQIKRILRPALMTALILTLAVGLDEYLTTSTWIGLILAVAITLGGVSLFAFYTGLSGGQRRRILQRAAIVTRSARAS